MLNKEMYLILIMFNRDDTVQVSKIDWRKRKCYLYLILMISHDW